MDVGRAAQTMRPEVESRASITPPPLGGGSHGPTVEEKSAQQGKVAPRVSKAGEIRHGLPPEELARVVREALAEDVGTGDLTTEGVIAAEACCRARLILQEQGVVCGLAAAEAVFRTLDPDVGFEALVEDGETVRCALSELAFIEGSARALLTGERTALNFVGRLSGIATLTRRFVDAVAGTNVAILDTRKTTPGLRVFEKYAVSCGGGRNHRLGLYDGILVKDNHLRVTGGIRQAVRRLRSDGAVGHPIAVEAETLDDVCEALVEGADAILLDNMPPERIAEAAALVDGRAFLEASGGVTLDNVRAIAEAGVDLISVGALTHSARSLDVSMEVP